MAERRSGWLVGDRVQTPFGKGVIREVRSNGRVLVEVQARRLLLAPDALSAAGSSRRRGMARASDPAATGRPLGLETETPPAPAVVDLHGLTVEEALGTVDRALSDALLADVPQMRLIHGRSGGRIRAALHRHLRGAAGVRSFRIDPRNAGVTLVEL